MARVTVEDCLNHVENRFELVLKASQRAHALELGAVDPMVPKDNDKPTVIALREIAEGYDVEMVKRVIEEEQEKKQSKPEEEIEDVTEETVVSEDQSSPSAEETES